MAQILVNLVPPNLTPLYRGSALVEPKAVDRAGVTAFADWLATWLINQVDKTGRVTYEFHPSTGEEAPTDNTVRQALATLLPGADRQPLQEARGPGSGRAQPGLLHPPSPQDRRRVRHRLGRSISLMVPTWGLDSRGRQHRPRGQGEPKLGAMAILALTPVWRPKVKFFEKPAGGAGRDHQAPAAEGRLLPHPLRRDGPGRQPEFLSRGETLLFWATALRMKSPLIDAETHLKSARYYRSFFKKKPSRPSSPGHTQAHVVALESIEAPDLVKFVFEMNDWLVDLQQWQAPLPRHRRQILRSEAQDSWQRPCVGHRRLSGRADRRLWAGAAQRQVALGRIVTG